MQQERRLHPRAMVKLPAQLRVARAGGWIDVTLHDLSAGGAGIRTRYPVNVQDEAALRFRLPEHGGHDEREVTVSSLIVRVAGPTGPQSSPVYQAGLHFLDLYGEPFDRLRAWIWHLVSHDVG